MVLVFGFLGFKYLKPTSAQAVKTGFDSVEMCQAGRDYYQQFCILDAGWNCKQYEDGGTKWAIHMSDCPMFESPGKAGRPAHFNRGLFNECIGEFNPTGYGGGECIWEEPEPEPEPPGPIDFVWWDKFVNFFKNIFGKLSNWRWI